MSQMFVFWREGHVYKVENESFASRRSRLLVEPWCGHGPLCTESRLYQSTPGQFGEDGRATCPLCLARLREKVNTRETGDANQPAERAACGQRPGHFE
jgi:hypothetical protein